MVAGAAEGAGPLRSCPYAEYTFSQLNSEWGMLTIHE